MFTERPLYAKTVQELFCIYLRRTDATGGKHMRKLDNTLYITSPDVYLSLDGENVVIRKEDVELKRIPMHNLDGIVTCGYAGTSPALMGACAHRQINITFLSAHGRFLARVVGKEYGNVLLRKTQYRFSDDEHKSGEIAKGFLIGKLFNSRWVIERAIRDYELRLDTPKLSKVSCFIANAIRSVKNAETLDQLRGFEGEAASQYFSVFNDLILQQKEDFSFSSRNKRPPLDNVNAMLSFCYTLLAHDCASALETVGLDPYVGFLHRDRPGRISLALDLMEELRPILADRFDISLINKKLVRPDGFVKKENGAVVTDDDTRKIILNSWHKRNQEIITHPFTKDKMEWGLVPYMQSMLLSRFLRGDLDTYPSFLWK